MQPEVTKKIDRYLDDQLGMWTRILPWRRELAVHLEEAYQAAQQEATQLDSDGAPWRQTLARFGDVQQVAHQLRKEHWPQYIGWRVGAVVIALAVVFSIANPLALLDPPALGFALLPMFGFVLLDTLRGSTRWALANRVGAWGCVGGAVAGVVVILADWSNPANLGMGMALSLLSGMYCVLLFAPQRMIVIGLIGIALLDFGLMLVCMHSVCTAGGAAVSLEFYSPQHWGVEREFLVQILAILGAGVSLGIARFGCYGIARHALSVGAGIFLLGLVVMLSDMSDPRTVMGHLLVALGAMGLAIACSHFASDSARLFRRVLS